MIYSKFRRLSSVVIVFSCVVLPLSQAAVAQVQNLRYQSNESYQLNAADIFRMRKLMPEVNLRKSLAPLVGQTFYKQDRYISALEQALSAELVRQHQTVLLDKARQQGQQLAIDVLTDDMLHIRYQDIKEEADSASTVQTVSTIQSIETTELVDVSQFNGPDTFKVNNTFKVKNTNKQFITASLSVAINPDTLCINISSTVKGQLANFCGGQKGKLQFYSSGDYQLNGLGQEFKQPGKLDSNWLGKVRNGGNKMEGFNGGATGNTQLPILYATNSQQQNYAVYLDTLAAAKWDFTQQPWKVSAAGDDPSLLFMAGKDLPELRSQFMQLVGRPLVPPRKMFGLWLSEYGFDNWNELDDKLITLQQNSFPIDGVVMDLQWFGNVEAYSANSQMGSLTWDETNFPEPENKIKALKADGVGMMLIEESYISEGLKEFKQLAEKDYLALDPFTGKAINVDPNGSGYWWGRGGMLDWSYVAGGDFWHDSKRQPLIDMGVIGHWTDLGEPEMYNINAVYADNKPHVAIHNIYNYKWLESIYRGYERNKEQIRPFMMSRSGAVGIQRFGAVMWSGDIGSNLTSLASHISEQNNMVLSGIDYYSSDIGGFHRSALNKAGAERQPALDETYTQWFAYSSLFDVPVRPHTENLCNCKETAPDRIGDSASNKANIALRYELIPYLYSLAHRAYLFAEPVYPSMSYYFDDDALRNLPAQKMIGSQLLATAAAQLGQKSVDVYLPQGTWYDYRTGKAWSSEPSNEGQWLRQLPLYQAGRLQLPIFAKAGAIIPVKLASEEIANSDVPLTLALKIFTGNGEFILYEDDGVTNAYQQGAVRQTILVNQASELGQTLTISTNGDYAKAPSQRPVFIQWIGISQKVASVSINGKDISDWKQLDGSLELTTKAMPMTTDIKVKIKYL